MGAEPVLCPSFRCEPGALLLGVLLPGGRVAFASDRIVVDGSFAAAAQASGAPEQRFRFGGHCAQGACKQWTGSRCGVIDEAMQHAGGDVSAPLPACSIRPACRWFQQSGARACSVCPEVVTASRAGPATHGEGCLQEGPRVP